MTPYFTSGHQSSSCKGACTDVIQGFKPKMIFAVFPLRHLSPYTICETLEFFTLMFAVFLSYARVELLSISLQGFNLECTNGRISHIT